MEAMSAVAVEVEDLDAAGLLDAAAAAEPLDRLIQLTKLRIAYAWCVQHPVTAESGTAPWGDAGLPGLTNAWSPWPPPGTPPKTTRTPCAPSRTARRTPLAT